MNEKAHAIMDAAEARIRRAGYSGFSFREIAADVGVKSSSVHYHFATKDDLAAAVARRYADRFITNLNEASANCADIIKRWRQAFEQSLAQDGKMCLCGALSVTSADLPEMVVAEVRRFFELGLQNLTSAGLTRAQAMNVLATLEGAMLLATVLPDTDAFDAAVSMLVSKQQ